MAAQDIDAVIESVDWEHIIDEDDEKLARCLYTSDVNVTRDVDSY